MNLDESNYGQKAQLRRMRLVSVIEGSTLIVLFFIAVPLKHIAGYKIATTIIGPIHGVAFLLYVWTLLQTIAAMEWSRREIARMAVAAFVPFGAFFNERMLKNKEALLPSARESSL
jgi:integral membrane protein